MPTSKKKSVPSAPFAQLWAGAQGALFFFNSDLLINAPYSDIALLIQADQ